LTRKEVEETDMFPYVSNIDLLSYERREFLLPPIRDLLDSPELWAMLDKSRKLSASQQQTAC
jgi:hypothetical protein